MDLRDTHEEARFRATLREWIAGNLAPGLRGSRGTEEQLLGELRDWSRKLYEAGYAGLTWPKEYGGAGASYSAQAVYMEEMGRAEAPPHLNVIGIGMAGPTIIADGTPEQKERYLAKILSAEEIWCQGFSEPQAGSDLAAVRTRRSSRRRFVVNGQKVWSSIAHIADWCILVTQSDPDAPRYRNLTYLLVDMHSPGVEVRPLRQITGDPEFNEIFFTDAEVPVENVLGEIGDGWQVAMTTLLHERGTFGISLTASLEATVSRLLALAQTTMGADSRLRDAVAREWVELQALRYTNYRALSELVETGVPGPERLHLEAPVVGAEPAPDEARARAAPAGRARRRRLLALPAVAQPRQHDRGGHVRDSPRDHRRTRPRPAEGR